GRVEVEADVVAGCRGEMEAAGGRVARRTRLQRPAGQARQEADEGGRAVEREDRRRLLDERVVADAAALLVPRNVVAVDRGPHALDLGHHALDDRRREPALETDELVLLPVRLLHVVKVEAGERALEL